MKKVFSINRPSVTGTLAHEQRLNCCGGIKIIYTPGHTPGHICIYLEKYRTLIAGDALNIENGKLSGSNPNYTYDMVQAQKSISTLSEYDIKRVICYHGGIVR